MRNTTLQSNAAESPTSLSSVIFARGAATIDSVVFRNNSAASAGAFALT